MRQEFEGIADLALKAAGKGLPVYSIAMRQDSHGAYYMLSGAECGTYAFETLADAMREIAMEVDGKDAVVLIEVE